MKKIIFTLLLLIFIAPFGLGLLYYRAVVKAWEFEGGIYDTREEYIISNTSRLLERAVLKFIGEGLLFEQLRKIHKENYLRALEKIPEKDGERDIWTVRYYFDPYISVNYQSNKHRMTPELNNKAVTSISNLATKPIKNNYLDKYGRFNEYRDAVEFRLFYGVEIRVETFETEMKVYEATKIILKKMEDRELYKERIQANRYDRYQLYHIYTNILGQKLDTVSYLLNASKIYGAFKCDLELVDSYKKLIKELPGKIELNQLMSLKKRDKYIQDTLSDPNIIKTQQLVETECLNKEGNL